MEASVGEIISLLTQQLQSISETAALDAQVLVANTLEKSRTWILAHPEVQLNKTQQKKLSTASDRYLHGEPLPYVIGHWEFYGLEFQLTSEVLIPRPETELLVERGIQWLGQHDSRRKAADVGTGSGCIGICLAKNIPNLHLMMTDISAQALNVAMNNGRKNKVLDRMDFIQADLLGGVNGPFDLICANLPYIPTPLLMTLPVAEREPALALDGGMNGMQVIERLLKETRNKLEPGGLMLLEIESSQGSAVTSTAEVYFPGEKVHILKDLAGRERCLEIERPDRIVHLCSREAWQIASEGGIFRDRSLMEGGFIHCSQPTQILEVANRFYRGASELVVLWIEPDRVTSEIRWEPADGSLYPHIYGPINLDAITAVTELTPDLDGIFRNFCWPN